MTPFPVGFNLPALLRAPACTGPRTAYSRRPWPMSALPPKADKEQTCRNVRFVPIPDIGKVSQVQYNRARGWGPKAGFPFERQPWEAPIDPMAGVAVYDSDIQP